MEELSLAAILSFLREILAYRPIVAIAGFFAVLFLIVLVSKRDSVAGLLIERHYDYKEMKLKKKFRKSK